MHIVTKNKKEVISYDSFELHKIYLNLINNYYYTLITISNYNYVLNLYTMQATKMKDLIVKPKEFIEVAYNLEIEGK